MSSYIDSGSSPRWDNPAHYWANHTRRRLHWCYGLDRANAIMAGLDPEANEDLRKWRELGRRAA